MRKGRLVALGPAVDVVAVELAAGFAVLALVIDEDFGFEVKLVAEGIGLAKFIVVVVVVNADVVAIGLFLVVPRSVEFGAALVTFESIIDIVSATLGLLELKEGFFLGILFDGAFQADERSHELVVSLALAVAVSGASERKLGVFVVEILGGLDELADARGALGLFSHFLCHRESLEAKGG